MKTKKKPESTAPILGPVVAVNLVRLRRRADDLTQDALATRAALDQSAVSRIENGQSTSLATLEKLAAAMGAHPLELFRRRKS